MGSNLPGSATVRPLGALSWKLDRLRFRKKTAVLVGVDGCGGAGKSTLSRRLAAAMPVSCIVELDDFYHPSDRRQDRAGEVGGHFDWRRLERQVLTPLSEGRDGRFQRYDWSLDALAEWREVPNRGVVIVEGVYATRHELRQYFDLTIWVEASRECRLSRGLARDEEAARDRWVRDWMPAEDRYVASHAPARSATLVVLGEQFASVDPDSQYVELTLDSAPDTGGG